MIKCFVNVSQTLIKSSLQKEKLEELFKHSKIPVIYPLSSNGQSLQVVDDEVFYVFLFRLVR